MPGSAFWHTVEHDKALRNLRVPGEREPNFFLDLYKSMTGKECPKTQQTAGKPEEPNAKPSESSQSGKEVARKFENFMWKRS